MSVNRARARRKRKKERRDRRLTLWAKELLANADAVLDAGAVLGLESTHRSTWGLSWRNTPPTRAALAAAIKQAIESGLGSLPPAQVSIAPPTPEDVKAGIMVAHISIPIPQAAIRLTFEQEPDDV